MTFTAEAQAAATKLQQAREYLEMYDPQEQPELVAELKAYAAEQKRKLEEMGIFAA